MLQISSLISKQESQVISYEPPICGDAGELNCPTSKMQQSTLSIPASKHRANAMGPAGAWDARRKMHGDYILYIYFSIIYIYIEILIKNINNNNNNKNKIIIIMIVIIIIYVFFKLYIYSFHTYIYIERLIYIYRI